MAKENDFQFEESGSSEDDLEIIEVDSIGDIPKEPEEPSEDEGLPEELKGKSKKELWEMLQKGQNNADTAQALREGIADLGKTLQKPPPVENQQPGESDEEFRERIEKELFNNPGTALDEYGNRLTGKIVSTYSPIIMEQQRRIMKLDPSTGENFKRFESEIDETLATLSPRDQNNPKALEWAYKQVLDRHQEEIASEKIEDQVEKKVAERLKELGVSEGKPTKSVETSKGMSVTGRPKTKLYATKEDRRIADIKGMPLQVYLERKQRGLS